jgi:hypothetical protein
LHRNMEASLIIAPDDLMSIGLELVGFGAYRQKSVQRATNLKRFKSFYGSAPVVYANIWEDLMTTDIEEARVSPSDAVLKNYLLAIHFLKVYPTDERLAGQFKTCVKTARKWEWQNNCYGFRFLRMKSNLYLLIYENYLLVKILKVICNEFMSCSMLLVHM